MDLPTFRARLREIAPRLADEVGGLPLLTAGRRIAARTSFPETIAPSDSVDERLGAIWRHVVETGWTEEPEL